MSRNKRKLGKKRMDYVFDPFTPAAVRKQKNHLLFIVSMITN